MTPASSPELLQQIRAILDPLALSGPGVPQTLPPAHGRRDHLALRPVVALVGHRAAGKSRLLPLVCRWTGLPGVDLDRLIAESAGQDLASFFNIDPAAFRAAERRAFASIRGPAVVATGGGFLSLHADLLRDHTAVLVPITFETYRARLLGDASRPRLRPQLSLEDEIAQVYIEREERHAAVQTIPLLEFLHLSATSQPAQWP